VQLQCIAEYYGTSSEHIKLFALCRWSTSCNIKTKGTEPVAVYNACQAVKFVIETMRAAHVCSHAESECQVQCTTASTEAERERAKRLWPVE
jgi:hypothetical protein